MASPHLRSPNPHSGGRANNRRLARAAIAGAGWLTVVACGTVDIGPAPADVNACRPSQTFFYDMVYPQFLAKATADGRRCGDSQCHDPASGRALVVGTPTSVWSDRTQPMPDDWTAVYKSAADQVLCTNVSGSPLLTRPDGRTKHGPGKLIEPDGPEEQLVRQWVSAP